MTYTIQLDLWFDEDEITENKVVEDFVKEQLASSSIDVSNCRVIDVND
jgi:hypothetical protein